MNEIQAKRRRRWFRYTMPMLFVFVTACLLVALYSTAMQGSNCGGNSAALTACGQYATAIQSWQVNHPSETPNTFLEVLQLPPPGQSWLHEAKLLANPDAFHIAAKVPKQVVLVCDHAYSNVPRRPWPLPRAPLTHAVAYSDGTTGLISRDEFARLDRSRFVELDAASAIMPAAPSR